MSLSSGNRTQDKGSAVYWYVGMIILLALVIIVGTCKNISIMNSQFKKNEMAISNSRQVNNPLKFLNTDSTKTINLNEEDLRRLNDHIDYLSDKVQEEVKRSEDNNQYDVDRITAFIAIGIGLLTIIGGLLPLFVNYFSKELLEKRICDIEDKSDVITLAANEAKTKADNAREDAEIAKDNANKANVNIAGVESIVAQLGEDLKPMKKDVEKVKEATKKIPVIDLLVFQNAVARFTSTDAMKLNIGKERLEWIVGYLENLNSALENFDDGKIHSFESYTPEELKYFKSCISELKVALFAGPIRWITNRNTQPKIDEAVSQLSQFDKLDVKNYKAQIKSVSKTILELKELIENNSA